MVHKAQAESLCFFRMSLALTTIGVLVCRMEISIAASKLKLEDNRHASYNVSHLEQRPVANAVSCTSGYGDHEIPRERTCSMRKRGGRLGHLSDGVDKMLSLCTGAELRIQSIAHERV